MVKNQANNIGLYFFCQKVKPEHSKLQIFLFLILSRKKYYFKGYLVRKLSKQALVAVN
jgi:hypothetical protein